MKTLGKCTRCRIGVKDKDHYIKLEEHVEGKLDKTNFVHFKCWEETMTTKKLMGGMMNRTLNLLNKAEAQFA